MKLKPLQKKNFLILAGLMLLINLAAKVTKLGQPNQYLFDEDMHAFTASLMAKNDPRAYEWWHPALNQEQNQYSYRAPAVEWLHPPLAKHFQALSIKLFGNRPFAWRLPSALAGVGVTFLVIALTMSLTKSYWFSLLNGSLISLEHLTGIQSRIASADIFLALFVLLTVWFYWRLIEKTTGLRLLLTGLSFGLCLATKWSGLFLLPGLLIFHWFYQPAQGKLLKFSQRLQKIFLLNFAVITVGLAVYVLSYTPAFLLGKNAEDIAELHSQACWYQTHTSFTHPYQSRPLDWLIGQKPVWYYYQPTEHGEEKIIAQPTVWLLILSELSLILSASKLLKNKNKHQKTASYFNQNLLLVGVIASLWLPWFFIPRTLFIYQLTPIMPLLIITLSNLLSQSKIFKFS